MGPTLRQLEYAVAVADLRHFGRAAEACHVSQPGLSSQVAGLEKLLGVRIFERSSRGVLVTPAGEEVISRARRVLAGVDDLVAVAAASDGLVGRLSVGVIPTLAPYLLPTVLPELRTRFPELRLALVEDRTHGLLDRLRGGRLDAALLALPLPGPSADLASTALFDEEFVVALPPGHRLRRRRAVSTEDLQGEQLLLLEDGHCLRDQALEVYSAARADVAELEATSLLTLVQMVAGGMGVTLLPAGAVRAESTDGVAIRPFRDPAPTRTIGLVWRTSSRRRAAMEDLGAAIAELAHDALGVRAPRT